MSRDTFLPSSRAQQLRGRRVMNSQVRMARVTHNVVTSAPPRRPVTVRGATIGAPSIGASGIGSPRTGVLHQPNLVNPRKRLYIPLPNSGVEMRLPAIPVIRPGWRLLSFFISALCLAAIIGAFSVPSLQIESIQVSGIKRIKPADIEAVLDLEGLSIVQVDIAAIEKKLIEKFPELMDTQVSVKFPALVSIQSKERQPVMAWRTDKTTVWIDKEGYVIPQRGEAEGLVSIQSRDGPPVIVEVKEKKSSGTEKDTKETTEVKPIPLGPQRIPATLVSAAQVLSNRLPKETQILYNHPNGLGWVDPRGWNVLFGMNMENIETRMNIYQSISDQLAQKGVKASLVSVEFIDAPYYRTER